MAPKRKRSEVSDAIVVHSVRSVRKHTRDSAETSIATTPRRPPRKRRPPKPKSSGITFKSLQPVVTSHTSSTGLLKLPRELRDRIYHELWTKGPRIKQRYEKQDCIVTYGHADVTFRSEWFPGFRHPWLLACKQIMYEGIQQLHEDSVWHFDDDGKEPDHTLESYQFPLLIPEHARSLHVRSTKYERCTYRKPFYVFSGPYRAVMPALQEIVPESNIDSINLTLYLIDHWRTNYRLKPHFVIEELRELERLAATTHTQLTSFVVTALCNRLRFLEKPFADTLKRDVVRVGQALVKGGMESDETKLVMVGKHEKLYDKCWCWEYRIERVE